MTEEGINWRRLRCEPNEYPIDEEKKGCLKFKDGIFGKYIFVAGNSVTFDFGNIYPDDALAFIRDMLITLNKSRPDPDNEKAIGHIQSAIEVMDQRALKRHGYSHSEIEKNYVPPYLKNP